MFTVESGFLVGFVCGVIHFWLLVVLIFNICVGLFINSQVSFSFGIKFIRGLCVICYFRGRHMNISQSIINNRFSAKKSVIACSALFLLVVLAFSPLTSASSYTPTIGVATVNGVLDTDEWDLSADFFAGMYNGWSATKNHEASVYLKYDPPSDTLYVLVLVEPGYVGVVDSEESWVSIQSSDNGMTSPKVVFKDFAYVGESGGYCQGYEASFKLEPGSWWIVVHLNVKMPEDEKPLEDIEPETAGTDGKTIPLVVPPDFVVPETPLATTLLSILGAAGVFMVYRRKQQKK